MKKNAIKTAVISLFLIAMVMFSACGSSASAAKAPDFTLLNLENKPVSLSDFKGKVVLLNYFATYCPPCRAEIPDFIGLQTKYAAKGFTVIGISVDDDWQKVLPSFTKALKINYPVLIATPKVLKDYGDIYALPSTFIIDRQGDVVKNYVGMVTTDEVEPVILKAVAGK
ncbi:MAG: TlpA disulfide reductase family protein [Desulfobacteraceae bacterium]|nr:TlpA disulfide reductase family protein [Desulfobacteraceae bacterium]